MDRTEKIAAEFLKLLGHPSTYEPDGNVPPDFVTGNGTAIEVRRLNQIHVDHNGKVQGLENADMALWQTMKELINGYQTSVELENTIGVFYMFGRPLPKRRAIARELKAAFDAYLKGNRDFPERVTLPCGISSQIL